MKTKTLIQYFNEIIRDYQKHIGWDNLKCEARDEIIQCLREYDELREEVKKLIDECQILRNILGYEKLPHPIRK